MISSPSSVRSATSHLAVAQVLDEGGTVAGAGFLMADGVLLTCAHVVLAARGEPDATVRLRFPQVDGAPEAVGLVLADGWSPPDARDVAVVRLERVPRGVPVLRLGSASRSRGHRVWSFGFPGQAVEGGHHGYAIAGDLLRDRALLQLTDANDITRMYSGAPVVDETTGLVIGMVTMITKPDAFQRGQEIVYATPAESLRTAWPDLVVSDDCPYQGLEPFTAEQAAWFHGRGNAVRKVIAGIRAHPRSVLILGPSGAGKTSLIQAGVVPALADGAIAGSDQWDVLLTRPGHDLLAGLDRTADLAGRQRLVLVVDQFEQLLARSGQADRDALDRIAVQIGTPHLTVVLVMRDDFYSALAAEASDLLEAVGPGVVNIPATLARPDLQDIITNPAAAAGAYFQDGLPERIITDVLKAPGRGSGQDEAPATVLPVLEVALAQLWKRRDDAGALTHDAYRQIGGISGSLTDWCDKAISALPSDTVHRRTARRVLTALVRPADPDHRFPAVRQQVSLTKLRELAGADDDQVADLVLETLVRHRVIIIRTLEPWSGERRLPRTTAAFVTASRRNSVRSRRIRHFVLAGMALLTVAATAASIVAVRNATEANRQHVIGLSRQLAAQSQAVAATLPLTARRLAAAAWDSAPTDEAKAAITSLQAQQQTTIVGHVGAVAAVAFSPDQDHRRVAARERHQHPQRRRLVDTTRRARRRSVTGTTVVLPLP